MTILYNSIGWCDDTTNAVTGCDKVSAGCAYCYAETGTRARVLRSLGIETWGSKGTRHPVAGFAAKMRRLNKLCVCERCHQTRPFVEVSEVHQYRVVESSSINAESGKLEKSFEKVWCGGKLRRIRLFADSNSDWLDTKWPIETLAAFLNEIRQAPNIDVQLLTKRPENWHYRVSQSMGFASSHDGVWPVETMSWCVRWLGGQAPTNLWLGVSAENQKCWDDRVHRLAREIPAAVKFVSMEPLLESVLLSLGAIVKCPIDWVIVGGESGSKRRDCGVDAIVRAAAQCRDVGVPVYVKQDCAFKSGRQGRIPDAIWALKQFPRR